jgi:hypothetical protein
MRTFKSKSGSIALEIICLPAFQGRERPGAGGIE